MTERNIQSNNRPLAKEDMELLGKVIKNVIDEIATVLKGMQKVISKVYIEPLYDTMMKGASAENPRWYHYYKNGKSEKTREKYRLLLENNILVMAKNKREIEKHTIVGGKS